MTVQIILAILVLLSGFSAISFIFWVLFKKDAPSIEDLNL